MATRTAAIAFLSSAPLTMPTPEERAKLRVRGGGNKAVYDFAGLEVGKSIAVTNRTARQLTTTLSTLNNGDKAIPINDPTGKPIMEPKKDANGAPVKGADGKIVMVTKNRKFFAVDCNPETDPDKATARIWREA